MKSKLTGILAVFASFFAAGFASAQDLGPQIRKLEDGVYVYVGKNFNSNCGIVLTQEGVVLTDSGHNPTDSRAVLAAVTKLTPRPASSSTRSTTCGPSCRFPTSSPPRG